MKNKIFCLPIILIMILGMAGIGYAAITCTFQQTATTVGTADTYIKGDAVNLSVSIDTSSQVGTVENATNATISVSSGTITGALTNQQPDGTNATYLNTTVNTLQLPDVDTLTYTMTIYNESAESIATCTRDFITDNTIPVLTSLSPATATKNEGGDNVVFSTTCTNTSGSPTLYLDGVVHTMSRTGTDCTFTKTHLQDQIWSWYIIASDGLNSTTSSTLTLDVQETGGYVAQEEVVQTTGDAVTIGGGNNTIAIIALVVLFLMFGQKGSGTKKRRK